MANFRRGQAASLHNEANETITVAVDGDAFLVPPEAWLQVTSAGLVYIAYAGDAPMLAHPITLQSRRSAAGPQA